MQSMIILALLAVLSVFMLTEKARNDSGYLNSTADAKAGFVAENILRHVDLLQKTASINYSKWFNSNPLKPGHIEGIHLVYQDQLVSRYTQENQFYEYKDLAFNYSPPLKIGESTSNSILYIATTWNDPIYKTYQNIGANQIMGILGDMLGKKLYQGDRTYWVVPWVIKNNNCQVVEDFTQVPENAENHSQLANLKNAFTQICNEIQSDKEANFVFGKYVYLRPIYVPKAN